MLSTAAMCAWFLVAGDLMMAQGALPMNWQTQLSRESFEGSGGKLPYRLLRPVKEEKGKSYPLVIFLHGAGERGTENETPLVHGVKEFVKVREKYPCFLIAPQCPEGKRWVEVDWSSRSHAMPGDPSDPMKSLIELIDQLGEKLPIDKKRIYVTGLSMGGYGTWDLLARQPGRFAAGVPVCGGADEKQATKIAKTPVWAFHGGKDTVVIPERSRNAIEAVKKAGGITRYVEYPDVGHDSWNRAYADPEMMSWLFGQNR